MNKQIIGQTGDDRVEEIYSDACESIHAPQELYGKVMDMTEEKIRMIRIKRLAIAAAFLVTLIIGSNVITYAITNKGWIERLKVTIDSSDVNIVDILEEEDSNGRTHYLITYQAEANGKSISIGTCDPGILEGKTFRVEGDKIFVTDADGNEHIVNAIDSEAIFVTDADGNEHIVNAIDSEAEGYTAVLAIPIPYPED